MRTNSAQNPSSPDPSSFDPTAEVLRQEWLGAMRRLEGREHDFAERRSARRAKTDRYTEKLASLIKLREDEYAHDRERIRGALEVCTQDLDAAHKAASRHCGEIGVRYVPGRTSEEDVLRVPVLQDAEAARMLDLKIGARFSHSRHPAVYWIVTLLCGAVTVVSLMGFLGVSLRDPMQKPMAFAGAVLFGLAVPVAGRHFLHPSWRSVGARVGAGRPAQEVAQAKAVAALITAVAVAGVMTIDGLGLVRASSARASLDSALGVPLWAALLGAGVVNLLYICGSAYWAFGEGYDETAGAAVRGLVRSDEQRKQEDRKGRVMVQAALDALGQVKVVEGRIEEYRTELKRAEQEFAQALNELLEAMPEEPVGIAPEEEAEIEALREKVTVAKHRYDAHVSSRGVNFAVADRPLSLEEN